MASAVRYCFTSCLSSTSHCARFLQHPEGQYKIVRAIDPIFDTVGEIAKAHHASEATLAGISYGRDSVRMLRNILSIFHIFTEVVPSLIYALKLFYDLIKGLFTGQDVQLYFFKILDKPVYYGVAKGNLEKFLCLGIVSAKCLKGGSATVASAFHPLITFETHHATLFVKHGSGVVGYAFELWYHAVSFHRALADGETSEWVYPIFVKKIVELATGLVEKVLQLIYDLARVFQKVPPAWFRLPLTFSIAAIGLYKVWRKTT